MGIYSGTVSFNRFRVIGSSKRPSIAKLSELIDAFKAPPLKIDGAPKAEAIGWVRPMTPKDPEIIGDDAHWDISDCTVSGGILLRVRCEKRKIPASLLQLILRQKLTHHFQSTGKSMPRADRQKLKEDIASDLLRRTLPQVKFIDILWRDDHQELLVFNASKNSCEQAVQLFNNTFGDELELSIIRLTTTTSWIETEESDHRLAQIANTQPAVFAQSLN